MPTRVNAEDSVGRNDDDPSTSGRTLLEDSKKDRIKVVVRVRPVTVKPNKKYATVVDDKTILVEDDKIITDTKRQKSYDGYRFNFDAVFDEDSTQEEVYNVTAKSLINEMIAGYNGMIFAYGATGSGKTYTMMAMNYSMDDSIDYNKCGIVIQAFKDLFSIVEKHKEKFIVSLSYMEIYNETIRDLFNTNGNYLELRGNGDIQVLGLSEVVVTSSLQAINLLRKGNDIRSVRYTGANSASSRSHAILLIILRQTTELPSYGSFKPAAAKQSKLLFVDLAGSERAKHTKNKGKRLQEGGHINKSLLALGNCISALSNGTKVFHVNFRDSKLTRLLREPLSGNYRTIMIAQVNPSSEYKEDVKNTLNFASKAMGITKRLKPNTIYPDNNQVFRYQNLIGELHDEVFRLKSKIKEQSHESRGLNKNYNKAKKLRDEMISVFEGRMKLRQQLLDVDNHLLSLSSETEKQHQIVSHWQSKSSKLYYWRNSPNYDTDDGKNAVALRHLNKATSAMNSIEKKQDEFLRYRNELTEKLELMKEKAIHLENELANLDEDTEKELLKLFCRVHELEAEKLSLQGERTLDSFELRRFKDFIIQYQEQENISDNIITKQRQLIEENKIYIPTDLQSLYQLYQEKIHVTTLQNFKNDTTYFEAEHFGLPALKENEKDDSIPNLRSQIRTLSSSSDSNEDWIDQDVKLARLPKVVSSSGNDDGNVRSSNPSPVPVAVLFPPITF